MTEVLTSIAIPSAAPANSHSTTFRRKVGGDDEGDDMPLLIVPILNGENLKGPLRWRHPGPEGPVRGTLEGLPLMAPTTPTTVLSFMGGME